MGCDGKEEDSEETKRLKQQARLVRKAKRARAKAKREARQQAKKLLLRLAEEGGVEGLHSAADTDGNGTLSAEEFSTVLGWWGALDDDAAADTWD